MDAQAAVIEIVERTARPQGEDGLGVIVPNEVRINGSPVLVLDGSVKVHEMDLSPDAAVLVTLTLFARRVVIGEEAVEQAQVSLTKAND